MPISSGDKRYRPCVRVFLLRVVGLVEDQKIDLIHLDKSIVKAMAEDLCCAYYYHVLFELFIPDRLIPEVCSHGPEEIGHILIYVVAQHR